MSPDFWKQRWTTNQIGFHEGHPNAMLTALWPGLQVPAGGRVFVPLCGKSLDMAWLAGQGHSVLGVELSEIAVREFFAESGVEPVREQRDGFAISRAGAIEVWCGDFFALEPRHLSGVAAVYDRASLYAMPPAMQPAYVAKMIEILPAAAPTLLLTFDYDQSEMQGPPFSVPAARVEELFGRDCLIEQLDRRETLSTHPYLKARGLTRADSIAFRLTRR